MALTIGRLLLVGTATLALTACSGGSDGGSVVGGGEVGGPVGGGGAVGGGEGATPTPPSAYALLAGEAQRLGGEIEELEFTDPSALPDSGSVQYDGVMGLVADGAFYEPQAVLMGDLRMTVPFDGTTPMSGTVTGIVNGANESYGGQLGLNGHYFDRVTDPYDDYTFGLGIDGELVDPDGTSWQVDAYMDGNFVGPDHSHVTGPAFGGAYSGTSYMGLDGFFAAERQR